MSQFALPGGDTIPALKTSTDWADQDGMVGVPLQLSGWEMVRTMDDHDGTAALKIDDNSHVKCPNVQGQHVLVTLLDSNASLAFPLGSPGTTSGFTFRVRMRKDLGSGGNVDALVELRNNYVDEGNLGALICQIQQLNIDSTFTTYEHTLTAGEVNTITNYNGIFLRIVATSL